MVIANFDKGSTYKDVFRIYQYNYGQVLRIQGLTLPPAVEVHFSLQNTGGEATTRIGVTKDGVTDVVIPDSLLENGDIAQDYKIYAFIYLRNETSGQTEYKIAMHVTSRPKPEAFDRPEDAELFREAIKAVNDSAARSAESEKQAEGWAHGREDLPERAQDNAKYYSDQAREDSTKTDADRKEVERLVESASGIGEQVTKVEGLTKQAQTSATNAALSEQAAKESEDNAARARTGAEVAEGNAELAAQKAEQDKLIVEQAKDLVQQMGQEVLDNKNLVDKTAQNFDLKAQQALADVNNAGQAQTERVQTAGTTAVGNIKTAQNTATQAVETAKTEAIKAVQAEGTTQTGNVSAEGEKQVQAVKGAAQEIIADREQIAKNATDIADLKQGKADAIVENASGTPLNVKDGSGAFFEDFSMSGKTVQDGTPTPDASVKIVNAGDNGTIEITVTGKNLIDEKNIYKINVNWFIENKKFGGKGFNLKKGIPYTFSTDEMVSGLYFNDYDTDENLIKVYGEQQLTYTPADDTKVNLLIYTESGIKDDMKVQLEVGLTATTYESYKEPQTLILQLDSPLTKWDRLEKRDGIWGIARQSLREELTYSDFAQYILGDGNYPAGTYCFALKMPKAILENQSSLCTHFKNSTYAYTASNAKIGLYSDHNIVKYKYFVTDKPTVEEFKAWLVQQKEAGTPVELVYKTAEETWEPLPEETQLALNAFHTNYPTTIVTNSEDTEMQLTYVADTKNYYLSREQAIQKQILEIQNALISQKISGGGIIQVKDSAKLPVQNLRVFGKSKQITTIGKNLWSLGDVSFNTYKELLINYPAGDYVLSYSVETEATSTTTQVGINTDGNWKYSKIEKGNRAIIKISSTTGVTAVRFYAGDSSAYNVNAQYYDIQVEEGTEATGYEPYTGGKPSPSPEYPQEIVTAGGSGTIDLEITGENVEPQSITLQTPNGLPGIRVKLGGNYTDSTGQRWICDEIDLEKNEYIKRTDCVILDGVNIKFEEGIFGDGTKRTLKDVDETIRGMCNYMQSSMFAFNANYDFIFLYKEKMAPYFATVEQLNNFLIQKKTEGNPVKVYYALRNPARYNLPQSETEGYKKLYTNYPTTIITNDENAEMELTYTADTKTYVDTKIAEVSAAIVKGV